MLGRVCGTRSDLNDALSVARELSLPWAMNLARQEQTHDTDQLQVDALSRAVCLVHAEESSDVWGKCFGRTKWASLARSCLSIF